MTQEVTITSLVSTCSACPSQWEGETSDGLIVYIRFRWGHLAATAAPTLERAVTCLRADDEAIVLFDETVSDGLDGTMDELTMRSYLAKKGVKFNYA